MSIFVDTVQMQWAGSTGSIDRDGPVEYLAIWHLQVDNGLDQAQYILIWWQENRFGLGEPYRYANDTFASLATCQNIRAVRKPETHDWWNIEIRYTRETDDSKRTIDDEPETIDPLNYRPEVHCSSSIVTKAGDKMLYMGGYAAGVELKIPDGLTVPVASNLTPFDPLPEVDVAHWYVSVKMNLFAFFGNTMSVVSYLNSETFSIDYKGFTYGPIAPHQAKIRDCEVSFVREHTTDFWAVRYYFEILPAGQTWDIEIPDIGMSASACEGDPDLHGGYYGGAGGIDPIEGRVKTTALIDPHGMPIRSPVLLNGAGGAANLCIAPVTPVYSKWGSGLETDFNFNQVIKSILAPV